MSPLQQRLLTAGLVLVLTQPSFAGNGAGFKVEMARVSLLNDVYVVDAEINYRLSDQARQALDNSIPLTVNLELEIRKPDGLLWDTRVARVLREFRIEHLPLTDKYIIDDLITGTRQNFYTLEDSLEALGHVVQIALVERRRLETDTRYRAFLRTGLELEALPAPMRLRAYFSAGWRLNSGWFKWDFDS